MNTYAGWLHSRRCHAPWICRLNQKMAAGSSRVNLFKAKKAVWPHQPSCTPAQMTAQSSKGRPTSRLMNRAIIRRFRAGVVTSENNSTSFSPACCFKSWPQRGQETLTKIVDRIPKWMVESGVQSA